MPRQEDLAGTPTGPGKDGAEPEWYLPREIAAMFRVSEKTVNRWCRADDIYAIQLPSGHWRIPRKGKERLEKGVGPTSSSSDGDYA